MTRHDITPKAIRWAQIRHLQKRFVSAKDKQGKGYATVWRSREAKGWRHPPPPPPTPKSDKKHHQRSQQGNGERARRSNRRNKGRLRRKYRPKLQGNEIVDLCNTGTETIHERNRKFRPRSSHTKEVIIIKKRPNKMNPKQITLQ